MPSAEYEWFSEREREYLADPEAFDAQEAAEIRYRLRKKRAATVEAVTRLYDVPELWDKREKSHTGTLTCRQCLTDVECPVYEYEVTGELTMQPAAPDEWHDVSLTPKSAARGYGWCPDCWTETRERGRELAAEKGRVPCTGHDCNTHRIREQGRAGPPETLRECADVGRVPFTEDELSALLEEYHDRRERVCPECGRHTDDMAETDGERIPVYDADAGEDGEVVDHDAPLACACGWEGYEQDATLRKRD